jgi:hypothetical protein
MASASASADGWQKGELIAGLQGGVSVGELPVDRHSDRLIEIAGQLQLQPQLTRCEPSIVVWVCRPLLFSPAGLFAKPSEQQDPDLSRTWSSHEHNANHRCIRSLATMASSPLLMT